MIAGDTSIVYVRRSSDDSLRDIAALAETYYNRAFYDFLVLDLSEDETALSVLAMIGDPFRYLTAPSSLLIDDVEKYGMNATTRKKVVFFDVLSSNMNFYLWPGRDVEFRAQQKTLL